MATGNFYNRNASLVFANHIEDEFDYEDLLSNLQYEFDESFGKNFTELNQWENGSRSHCGKIFGSVSGEVKTFKRLDIDMYVDVELIVRNGYYEGVNLDWEAKVMVNGESFSVEDLEDGYFTPEYSTPLEILYNKWILKFAEREIEKIISRVEEIYKRNSINLVVKARFSNGETIYEKV